MRYYPNYLRKIVLKSKKIEQAALQELSSCKAVFIVIRTCFVLIYGLSQFENIHKIKVVGSVKY